MFEMELEVDIWLHWNAGLMLEKNTQQKDNPRSDFHFLR